MVVLNRGRIQQIGAPQSIYARHTTDGCYFLRQSTDEYLACNYIGTGFQLGDQFYRAYQMFWKIATSPGARLWGFVRSIEIFESQQRREEVGCLVVEVKVIEPLGRDSC